MLVHSIYRRGCILCKGEITDERLISLGICSRCFPGFSDDIDKLFSSFYSNDVIAELLNTKEEINNWIEIFQKSLKVSPWSTQVSWAKRVILGRSFSLVAPTGIGKTTFGIITAISMAMKGKKSLIVVPTINLVKQVSEKIAEFCGNIGISPKVIMYSSKLTSKEKVSFKKDYSDKNYDIVIVTSSMVKNLVDLGDGVKFDFIFADDVDSLLKKSKNIDYIVMLSGFSREEIDKTLEFIKAKFLLGISKENKKFEENLRNYKEILETMQSIKSKEKGVLVVSSATGKPRGARVKLFKELFDFEVGRASDAVSNISNYYLISKNLEQDFLKILEFMGDGGIVFVPPERGVDYAKKVSNLINSKTNLKSVVISSEKGDEGLKKFKLGKVNVVVGVSTYYGTLVRGIDIPERIIYAIFLGLPSYKVIVDPTNLSVSSYQVLKILSELVVNIEDKNEKKKIESFIRRFRNNMGYENLLNQGREILKELLKQEKFIEILKNSTDIVLRNIDGKNFIVIPDVNTYIQASGRTSRLYVGGITKGISIVLESDEKLVDVTSRKYKWIKDVEWKEFSEEEVSKDLEIAKLDRKKLSLVASGKVENEVKRINKTVLIIVESPTKAKTISKLLGTPIERIIKGMNCYEVTTGNVTFIITSSKGHIFELVTDSEDLYGMKVMNGTLIPVYDAIKICQNCNKTFVSQENKCIYCNDSRYIDKIDNIISLIELAKEVDEVLLASDPDTEGEKISYDIFAFLSPYIKFFGGSIKRIRFHEVTYHAIKDSISRPEEVNINLVEAQLLRRIQDRLVGFGLSGFLKEKFSDDNVSAGRVQSPVLGWIVERFNEYNTSKTYFSEIVLSGQGEEISLSIEGKDEEIGVKLGSKAKVKILEEKNIELHPLPPFTTDTILSQANRSFGMSSDEVMKLLQDLFEEGFITYHRTDSTTVSAFGQNIAKEYLGVKGMEDLYMPRGWESEGAHECIRPTKSIDLQTLQLLLNEGIISTSTLKRSHLMVYDLIFKRFIVSQMKPILVKSLTYIINLGQREITVSRNVDVISEGWNKIGYLRIDKPLPEELVVIKVNCIKKPKVSLLSEADIIQMMKQRGIGRPSTYSKIISTLLKRRYVLSKNNRLIPTEKGIRVYSILKSRYGEFISEERTRYIEQVMDDVEQGRENYFSALDEIFKEYKYSIEISK
ncbi:MAG: reverse gyrase [Brevinematia bacterium]